MSPLLAMKHPAEPTSIVEDSPLPYHHMALTWAGTKRNRIGGASSRTFCPGTFSLGSCLQAEKQVFWG